jgi:hypothetical protein
MIRNMRGGAQASSATPALLVRCWIVSTAGTGAGLDDPRDRSVVEELFADETRHILKTRSDCLICSCHSSRVSPGGNLKATTAIIMVPPVNNDFTIYAFSDQCPVGQGQGLPFRRRRQHVRCTADSCGPIASPNSAASGGKRTPRRCAFNMNNARPAASVAESCITEIKRKESAAPSRLYSFGNPASALTISWRLTIPTTRPFRTTGTRLMR